MVPDLVPNSVMAATPIPVSWQNTWGRIAAITILPTIGKRFYLLQSKGSGNWEKVAPVDTNSWHSWLTIPGPFATPLPLAASCYRKWKVKCFPIFPCSFGMLYDHIWPIRYNWILKLFFFFLSIGYISPGICIYTYSQINGVQSNLNYLSSWYFCH